uniref:Reverse transcriptase domain-containing protein n=1 Tax=Strongyloides papillosus TaxID=174720 RepID=A0A0N5BP02_STREA
MPLFVIIQRDKPRVIYDARHLNEFLTVESFKLEDAHFLLDSIANRQFYAISFDISSAYYSITVNKKSRQLFVVKYNNKTYVYKRMPMGISIAPKIFSRVTGAITMHIREKYDNVMAFNYLDDFLVIYTNPEWLNKISIEVKELIKDLGLKINTEK